MFLKSCLSDRLLSEKLSTTPVWTWKNVFHVCLLHKAASRYLFDGRWHSKQRDQGCCSCVDMYLTMFQPQIFPPHFSMLSTGQKKTWWLKVFQVSLWLCPWMERCITGIQRCPESLSWRVTEEWQIKNRTSRGEKHPRKHETMKNSSWDVLQKLYLKAERRG